jgi:hypothetical protein
LTKSLDDLADSLREGEHAGAHHSGDGAREYDSADAALEGTGEKVALGTAIAGGASFYKAARHALNNPQPIRWWQ